MAPVVKLHHEPVKPEPVKWQTVGEAMSSETGLLSRIDQHTNSVLSIPFVLAVILAILYAFGWGDLRQVLDFMSTGHILAR